MSHPDEDAAIEVMAEYSQSMVKALRQLGFEYAHGFEARVPVIGDDGEPHMFPVTMWRKLVGDRWVFVPMPLIAKEGQVIPQGEGQAFLEMLSPDFVEELRSMLRGEPKPTKPAKPKRSFDRFRGRPKPKDFPTLADGSPDWYKRQSYMRPKGEGCERHPECLRDVDHEGHCKLYGDGEPDYWDGHCDERGKWF